jgi:uncharacterized protein YcfJ
VSDALSWTVNGAANGLAQRLVLRRQAPQADLWIVATVVGGILATVVGTTVGDGVVRRIVTGTVRGAITGGVMIWLLQQSRARVSNS